MGVTRPRLLLVTGAYFPEFSAGGLQSRAAAARLADRVQFRVLTTATDPRLPRRAIVDGIEVARVLAGVAGRMPALRSAVRMVWELLRALPRVDAVHIQGYSSKNILVTAMARLFARRVVLHLQTAKHDEPDTIRTQGRLAWWAFTGADLYLSVSPGLTDRFLAAGLPPDRIREVPNGVDATRFSPATSEERVVLRQRLNLPLERPLILFVGVMSPDKQPQVLFDAWVRLQHDPATASTLVFVGATNPDLFELGGRLADTVKARAQQSGFGDRVVFVPPTRDIQDYFRAADVFAMPSAREGLPIVLLEAMACGLAAVASHLPGSTDTMIEHGVNGLLVSPGDVAGFAAGLTTVLSSPQTAAAMGAAARQTVEARYTIERVAEQWLDAYQQLLASR